jgi:succinate-semialdehyde dehydrogenase/glutarate-semialdehyde dehydrogenase
MGAEETRQAIEAADRALPGWRAKTAKERAQVLRKWFDLMMANQEDLATLMTAEQGKPLTESRGEIAYAAAFIEWFGEEGKRIYGDTIPAHASDKRIVVTKEPSHDVGVRIEPVGTALGRRPSLSQASTTVVDTVAIRLPPHRRSSP